MRTPEEIKAEMLDECDDWDIEDYIARGQAEALREMAEHTYKSLTAMGRCPCCAAEHDACYCAEDA